MQVRELKISGAFEFIPPQYPDDRGKFVAPYQEAEFAKAVGHPLRVAQTNHSVSRRGSLRGVHFADVPPSQAKYVYCPRGRLLDVVVDLRVGSPTFGEWEAVELNDQDLHAVYLPEGVGHAFLALADDTTTNYLCSEGYRPGAEHGVNPLDPELGLPWPDDLDLILSDKDSSAPDLATALDTGLLPRYDDCLARYAELRAQHNG